MHAVGLIMLVEVRCAVVGVFYQGILLVVLLVKLFHRSVVGHLLLGPGDGVELFDFASLLLDQFS